MKMNTIGFGTWLITEEKTINTIIKEAIKGGYRLFDTAQVYNNETQIGQAIKESGIAREELFLTTKVAFQNIGKYAYESTKESLRRLQTNYIDLMLLHAHLTPEYDIEGYKQLIQAREEGLVKNIGVSNYSIADLENIYKEFGEYPSVNQIVVSPTSRIVDLEAFCKDNNIELTGYSIIKPYYNPNPFYINFELTNENKQQLEEIANQHQKSVANILNKWALQHGYHIIPKTEKPSRLSENLNYDFELTNEQMNIINSMNQLNSSTKYQEKVEDFKLMLPQNVTLEQVVQQGLLFDKNF